MKPDKGDPHALFAAVRKQYVVPHYQRHQTWNAENHWLPFWEDVEAKANEWLGGSKPETHYLGSVVLAPRNVGALRGVDRILIIDGQQRLSTLQYLLQALRLVAIEQGWLVGRAAIESALRNSGEDLMNDPTLERHKLLPTFRDRATHLTIMMAESMQELRERLSESFTKAGSLYKTQEHPRPLETTWFFYDQIMQWLKETGGESPLHNLEALHRAIMQSLQIIVLWLEDGDDPQVIFESLNGRGAPLRATDLIKNFIFMSAEAASADGIPRDLTLEDPLVKAWSDLDSEPWIEPVTRGRFTQTRLEWLVYYALQAESGEEVDSTSTYTAYRKWAAPKHGPAMPALQQVDRLRKHGRNLLALLNEDQTQPIGVFGRIANALDVTTTTPVALSIASLASTEEQRLMFRALASYLIRREACGLTKKGYNHIFLMLLRELRRHGCTPAVLETQLSSLQGEASVWPDNVRFQFVLLRRGVYGSGSARGLCRLLLANAAMSIAANAAAEAQWSPRWGDLHVEHLLPQSWYAHWPLADGPPVTEAEAQQVMAMPMEQIQGSPRFRVIFERETVKNTVGNLTILNSALNEELRNSSWRVKRGEIGANTQLRMNYDLAAFEGWGEQQIGRRSEMIARIAIEEWPHPGGSEVLAFAN